MRLFFNLFPLLLLGSIQSEKVFAKQRQLDNWEDDDGFGEDPTSPPAEDPNEEPEPVFSEEEPYYFDNEDPTKPPVDSMGETTMLGTLPPSLDQSADGSLDGEDTDETEDVLTSPATNSSENSGLAPPPASNTTSTNSLGNPYDATANTTTPVANSTISSPGNPTTLYSPTASPVSVSFHSTPTVVSPTYTPNIPTYAKPPIYNSSPNYHTTESPAGKNNMNDDGEYKSRDDDINTDDDKVEKEWEESPWANKSAKEIAEMAGSEMDSMVHDKYVPLVATAVSLVSFALILIVAQQMIENPNGLLAKICRCCVAVARILCWPFKMICCGGSRARDRRTHDRLPSSSGHPNGRVGGYSEDFEFT